MNSKDITSRKAERQARKKWNEVCTFRDEERKQASIVCQLRSIWGVVSVNGEMEGEEY